MANIPNCDALTWSKIIVDYGLNDREALSALRETLCGKTGSIVDPDVVTITHSDIDKEITARFEDNSRLILKDEEMRILSE